MNGTELLSKNVSPIQSLSRTCECVFFFVISWTFDILAKSSSNIVSFMFKQIYVLLSTLINIQTYVSLVLELFVKTNTQIHTHTHTKNIYKTFDT